MDGNDLKNSLMNDIVDILIANVEKEKLTEEEFPPIAAFVLERVKSVKNEYDAGQFLSELSEKWPIFSSLQVLQEGYHQEKVEGEVAEGVLHLTQNGNIEDAIALAKSATSN